MNSSLQCNKTAASAMRVLGMLRRTFTFKSKDLFIFLYKTCVIGKVLWLFSAPFPRCQCLQQGHHSCTQYSRRGVLNFLNFYMTQKTSLYCRRRRGDLIETYKLLKGYYDVDWSKIFQTRSPIEALQETCSTSVEGQIFHTQSC